VLLTAALTGCTGKSIEQDPIDDDEDNDHVELSFTLNVGGSRSSDGSGYGIDEVNADDTTSYGTVNENYIDPNNLHVYIFQNASNDKLGGNFYCEMKIRRFYSLDENNNTYKIKAETTSLPSSTNFRVVIAANWQYTPTTDTNITLVKLCFNKGSEYQYHYGGKSPFSTVSGTNTSCTSTAAGTVDYRDADGNPTYYMPTKETPMPMYGVKKLTTADYKDKQHSDIGSIYMVRSMAKIIVRSDPNKSNCHDIESVTLRYSYNVGMCAPVVMYNNSETQWLDSTIDPMNIPRTGSPSTYVSGLNDENPLGRIENLPFKKLEDNKFVIYIPSYNNLATKNTDCKVSYMTLKMKGLEKVDTLEFKDDSGKRFNLCRNYMYIYDVHTYKMPEYVVTAINSYSAADINFN
jgi:hypothetical protein